MIFIEQLNETEEWACQVSLHTVSSECEKRHASFLPCPLSAGACTGQKRHLRPVEYVKLNSLWFLKALNRAHHGFIHAELFSFSSCSPVDCGSSWFLFQNSAVSRVNVLKV